MQENLQIVACLSADATFLGRTEYFEFACRTAKGDDITALLSRKMLSKVGITDESVLFDLEGSTLLIGNEVDLNDRDVVTATAEERVQRVLDGEIYAPTGQPYRFILCSAAADRVVISATLRDRLRDTHAQTKAHVTAIREEQLRRKKVEAAMVRAMARLAGKTTSKTEVPDKEDDSADLPVNEGTPKEGDAEMPF